MTLLGAALAIPVMVHAQSAPGWQQIQGLVAGNESHDNALRQAYQRGYRRGHDNEVRTARSGRDRYHRGGEYTNRQAPHRTGQGSFGR